MPILEISEPSPGASLGIWQIEEKADDLKWELQWGQKDIIAYQAIKDPQRAMHWLCSRILLRRMLNTSSFIDLQAEESGKPFLNNLPQKLSISHSGNRVAVLIAEFEVGIDIQINKPGIEKLAHKFISKEEMSGITESTLSEQVHIFWCAKEALYKLYGRKKLDFKTNLFLQPFEWTEAGQTIGRIRKNGFTRELPVQFCRKEDYFMAYAIENK